MTATERADRTARADALCAGAYEQSGGPDQGVALVAVGGYGRAELAPYSDLDVVLVHDDGADLGELGQQVWYPLWDARANLDHAVRSFSEMLEQAGGDLRVALGLLDLRHLAGDPNLTLRLRAHVLAHWRKHAREQLPQLRALVRSRHELLGELAHAAVPDLKEAAGGIRDATVLRALTSTWLVDVPHVELERSRMALLDVRDHLHEVAGRGTDRIAPEHWTALSERLDLPGERAAQVFVRELGRRITHVSRLSWRRAEAALVRPSGPRPRRPQLTPLAPGVAMSGAEVVLAPGAKPAEDPVLLLRAAALAAERGAVLAPPTAARLAREIAPLPEPWPAEARHLLVRLLAAGRPLLEVWETLEETGALGRVLPEWERIRSLPHASPIHRFTVDRHVVETCIEAGALIRQVARPDVLMVAALLHDIGKGSLTEHSVAGAPIARRVAARMGFDADAVDLIGNLVRWHLLLSTTATTRDPEDPATLAVITEQVTRLDSLDLLATLTQADARATSPKAWSKWRAALILGLTARVRASLDHTAAVPVPATAEVVVPKEVRRGGVAFTVEETGDGARVTVVARDRIGLLADVAATLALQRVPVRAARVWAQDQYGVSVWDVAEAGVTAALLRERFEAIAEHRIDPTRRLRPTEPGAIAPSVDVRPEASTQATVLEVRTADRPGVVYLVCAALARMDVTVRSAHVDTVGPQAVDVFYLQEAYAAALSDQRAAQAAHAVRAALSGE